MIAPVSGSGEQLNLKSLGEDRGEEPFKEQPRTHRVQILAP